MKISEIIKGLQKVKKEHGDLMAVYAIDDEGNAFHEVVWTATPGYYNDNDGGFISKDHEEDWEEYGGNVNSVCIN